MTNLSKNSKPSNGRLLLKTALETIWHAIAIAIGFYIATLIFHIHH